MSFKKVPVPILAFVLLLIVGGYLLNAGGYIVLPEGITTEQNTSRGWSAVATGIETTDAGDLRIYLTIRNGTNDWSAMEAAADKPAAFTANGQAVNCDSVFVSTGGHRLAPGFQIRGYTSGKKSETIAQLIYVDCPNASAASGAKLKLDYSYVTGQYNYYEKDANKVDTTLEVDLDQVAADLTYPIAESAEGLIQPAGTEIKGLNDVTLTLTNVTRTGSGFEFAWQTHNPGTYPSYLHIGNPPVVGSDGIFYGYYETPDIVSVPITPADGNENWTTEVQAPAEVKDFYIMLSVETGKARLFANYAIDITDK